MISDVLAEAKDKMGKAVEAAKDDFATVRTGRANPALFQKVLVDYYGTPTPLAQLASMVNQEARTLLITPFDKSALKDIEKAIAGASHLGASVGNDGAVIRATLPELNEERRKEFVKLVKAKAEDGRTAVRGARRDARKDLEALEKDSDISTDELHRAEAELDRLTKSHEAEIDEALDAKTVELMEG